MNTYHAALWSDPHYAESRDREAEVWDVELETCGSGVAGWRIK